jgi:hypothetical protein
MCDLLAVRTMLEILISSFSTRHLATSPPSSFLLISPLAPYWASLKMSTRLYGPGNLVLERRTPKARLVPWQKPMHQGRGIRTQCPQPCSLPITRFETESEPEAKDSIWRYRSSVTQVDSDLKCVPGRQAGVHAGGYVGIQAGGGSGIQVGGCRTPLGPSASSPKEGSVLKK